MCGVGKQNPTLTRGRDQGNYHYLTLRSFQLMEAGKGGDVGAVELMCDNGASFPCKDTSRPTKSQHKPAFFSCSILCIGPGPLGQLQHCWWETGPVFPCL